MKVCGKDAVADIHLWELCVSSGARRGLRLSQELMLVTLVVGLSRIIRRVKARVKDLAFNRMSD